jgi:hypothetical protein
MQSICYSLLMFRLIHKRSMTMAEAPPPPLQTPATPYLASLFFKTEERVVMIRAPEQPKGWPIATAPPQMLLYMNT